YFTDLHTIIGAGTTTQTTNYVYEDQNPLQGINYYRLQQIDKNGVTTNLGNVSVNFNCAARELVAYPNPTKNSVSVKIADGVYNKATLFAIDGQELSFKPISKQDKEVYFDLGKLPKGTYILKLYGTSQKSIK